MGSFVIFIRKLQSELRLTNLNAVNQASQNNNSKLDILGILILLFKSKEHLKCLGVCTKGFPLLSHVILTTTLLGKGYC